VVGGLLSGDKEKREATWEGVFEPVRQPDWWQGDAKYHPAEYLEPASELERRLKGGEFVVTAEVAPPVTISTSKLAKNIDLVKPYVAAVNFTDSPSATPRMASWACGMVAVQRGVEPVVQIAARDRTRVGLQAEVLGVNAMGMKNILCLSGDNMKMAPEPRGRMDVLDIDSIQMLWILRRMRDEGHYLDGREMKFPPKYFLGAAASPYASEPKFQALREQKKVNAGAQFFQTNLIFDLEGLEVWLNELAKREVLGKVYILAGVTPMKSLKMAQYMDKEVPGIFVPKKLMDRMEAAGKGAEEEGVQIALELIEGIKKLEGIQGIHLMAVGWEEIVPRIVTESGLAPRLETVPEPAPVARPKAEA
jgi:methylenetetrahydrofolate reductase (NADPH)